MCTGGRTATTTAAADPVVSSVSDNSQTESATRNNAKKQRNKAGLASNTVSTDRTMLGGMVSADAAVKNDLG